jgi:hypothetical protein
MHRSHNQNRPDFELRSLAREIDLLRTEIRDSKKDHKNSESVFHNPTWLAILGLLGTVATGVWQLHAGRELEREKLRSTLIQEASKSGSSDTTLRNLQFLVKYGLIKDENDLISNLKANDVPSFTTEAPKPLTQTELKSLFGDPKIQSTNESENGFGKPDDAWVSENLVLVDLPQLEGVHGFPKSGKIKFHKKAAPHLQAAIAEIKERGLLSRINSFDGAWVPRNIRGSIGIYSPHAFGIAFDINVGSNVFGKSPPKSGEKGSVVDLVPIFEKHGFYWGGYFSRPDGNHFQYGIKSPTVTVDVSTTSTVQR